MKRAPFIFWMIIISILLTACSQETLLIYQGNLAARKGNYDVAIEKYDKVLKINPLNYEIYYNRGLALSYKGDFIKAVSDYSKAIEIKNDFKEAYHNRGIIYSKNKNDELAISDFTKALQLNPDNLLKYRLFFLRGYSFFRIGNFERAINDYTEAINYHFLAKVNPNELPELYFYRGEAWYGNGNLDKAIADYSIAIQKKPDYVKALSRRAATFFEKKDYALAFDDYEKAININPNNPELLNAYSWSLSSCPDNKFRNGTKALKLALKANEIKPNDVFILDTLANAYAENRDFVKAVKIQTKAISLIKYNNKNNEIDKNELLIRLKYFKAKKSWREK